MQTVYTLIHYYLGTVKESWANSADPDQTSHNMASDQGLHCLFTGLHGPPKSADKTDFGLVIYNHANFYRFGETSRYWSVKQMSDFLCFSLVNQRHISCITVYNRIMTNIENTVRAVHSCNNWFSIKIRIKATN